MAYVAARPLSPAVAAGVREMQMDVPKQGRSALLLAVPAIHYLSKRKEVNYEGAASNRKLVMLSMLVKAWLTGYFQIVKISMKHVRLIHKSALSLTH
jgi:hypothetical protein